MSSPREVVITGLGVVCPLGVGREPFWQALEEGKSGIRSFEASNGTKLPVRYAGLIRDFDARQFVQPRKTIKVMCHEIQIAYASAAMAMQDARLAKEAIDPERMGVVLGSEMYYGELEELTEAYRHCNENGEFQEERWGEVAFKDLFPLWMLKYLPNMAACHISIVHDARGPNNSIVQGGVSSLLSVMEASMVIQRGQADVMLAGGSGSSAEFTCLVFRGADYLSKWQGEPAGAARPFEAQRSGVVVGEGAGAFVLEEREHAERRGAPILARVAGFASRHELPGSPGQPRTGRAIRQSIEGALASAGMKAADIGHVNAHGESTIHQDQIEAQAIRAVLGDVPVTAPKSFFGDLSAGSGAVEMAASVLALAEGRVPRTLNYEQPDPACPVNVIRGESLVGAKPAALVLNQATTGQAVAVVLTGA